MNRSPLQYIATLLLAALAGTAWPDAIDDFLAALGAGDLQAEHLAKNAMTREVLAATSDTDNPYQAKLSELLRPGQPIPVRREALHLLAIAGNDAAVPTIAALLNDPVIGDDARLALQRIPGNAATDALIAALPSSRGPIRLGIIEALGARGSKAAIPALRELSRLQDSQAQWAALDALSRLGVPPTQVTELTAGFTPRENTIFSNAYLRAAFATFDAGDPKLAARLFGTAAAYYYYPFQASAALTGMEMSRTEGFFRQAIGYLDQPGIRETAIRLLKSTQIEGTDELLMRAWNVLSLSPKATLLTIIAHRNPEYLDALLDEAIAGPEPELRYVAARIRGLTPQQSDVQQVAERGSLWRREEAADTLLRFAREAETDGNSDDARQQYERIALSQSGVAQRIEALSGLERIASPRSRPALVRLKDALYEAVHLNQTTPLPRPQRVDVKIEDLESGESSRIVVRRQPEADQVRQLDPVAAGVQSSSGFKIALDRAYAAVLATEGDTAGIEELIAETDSEELLEFVGSLLDSLGDNPGDRS